KGNITSSKPTTLHDAINMGRELVEQAVQGRATRIESKEISLLQSRQLYMMPSTWVMNWLSKQFRVGLPELAYNNRFHELALMCPEFVPTERKKIEKRQETARAYAVAPADGRGYVGNLPKCNRCNFHHNRQCPPKCSKCQRTGHREKDCRYRVPALRDNEGVHARAYVVVENPQQNPNVIAGTFLLNDHYVCNLFDSGAEKSFVSSAFTPFIDITPTSLNTSYEVELADGKVVSTNTVLRGCTLTLYDHRFKINLLLTRLGSFDVIIGMDWLSYHRAIIDCYENIVRIPLPNGEILEVQGERPEKDPGSLACIKADEKKLDDIRVVRDFP
nr:hypothetical protein [Tanacetum cinerariifolium]